MIPLNQIKEGDKVVIKTQSGAYFTTVTKVTANQIHTHSFRFYRSNGLPATRSSIGCQISQELEVWQSLEDRTDKVRRQREAQEAELRARNQRMTYQLASQIVDSVDPGKSIAILEGLGEKKLRQILEWLEHRKGKG